MRYVPTASIRRKGVAWLFEGDVPRVDEVPVFWGKEKEIKAGSIGRGDWCWRSGMRSTDRFAKRTEADGGSK
jgi:hypothetical protein